MLTPEARNCSRMKVSASASMPLHRRDPNSIVRPFSWPNTSLMRKGTPRKGPWPRVASSSPSVRSGYVSTTALSVGLAFSTAAMAVSASSLGDTCFLATRSASPSPSYRAYSLSVIMVSASDVGLGLRSAAQAAAALFELLVRPRHRRLHDGFVLVGQAMAGRGGRHAAATVG